MSFVLVTGPNRPGPDLAVASLELGKSGQMNTPKAGYHPVRHDGRDSIADRLSDEVSWLRQCAGWLAHLDACVSSPAHLPDQEKP